MAEQCSDTEVTFRLARRRSSVPRARAVLRAVLEGWGVGRDVAETGELILSELVTNALRARAPHDRQVGVRIVRSAEDGLLWLEVSDAGAGRPEVRAPGRDETCGRGLLLVEALAECWGVRDRAGGIGKTVWARLKAPGLAPVPGGEEVAAITVQVGQRVRMWGAWRTVRSVRSEESPAGAPSIVLGLDEGPALWVDATEPVTVRRDAAPG
ncbi:ATP-binding protein [Streptomyces sp. NPDC056987]|uniref:ATP-binding protein n=1 Tax=Streptomyces sp. NPDC056987 TaxID=3345988 RepID=UPI00363596D1